MAIVFLHVRTNHVHRVVEAAISPSRVFSGWKAYASRALRVAEAEQPDRLHWTHGGHARRILTPEGLTKAMDYVLREQGEPMEVYWHDPRLAPAAPLPRP